MKKILFLICSLLISFTLSAMPLDLALGAGAKASVLTETSATFNIQVKLNNFNLYVEQQGLTSTQLAASFTFENNKTLRQDLFLVNKYTYTTGFYSVFDYLIGQDFITQYFYFKYRVGVQGGLNYPIGATNVQFTICPNLLIDTGITYKSFALGIQGSGSYLKEASLQTLPILTPYLSYDFTSVAIKLEADFQFVNYTFDRFPGIFSIAGRLSCTIKGSEK